MSGPRITPIPTTPAGVLLLSHRERKILELASMGYSYRQMAKYFGSTENSIKTAVSRLLPRLGADNITHAVAHALRHSLIE